MANESSPLQFEDIPLDEAQRMGRGPRMDPALYQAIKEKIHIPSDLVVDKRTAYIECSSALDFPLRHEAHAQDLL